MSQNAVIPTPDQQEIEQRISTYIERAKPFLERFGYDPQFYHRSVLNVFLRKPDMKKIFNFPDQRKQFQTALLEAAELGVIPDGKQAVIVQRGKYIQLDIPARGMRDIIRQNIKGIVVRSGVVCEGDEYVHENGLHLIVRHIKDKNRKPNAPILWAWAVAILPGSNEGEAEFEEMNIHELNAIRSMSPMAKNPNGPWVKHPHRMYEKTVLRRLFNNLPIRKVNIKLPRDPHMPADFDDQDVEPMEQFDAEPAYEVQPEPAPQPEPVPQPKRRGRPPKAKPAPPPPPPPPQEEEEEEYSDEEEYQVGNEFEEAPPF